jgi:5'-nucleotidase
MAGRKRILIANDDGIHARGIELLESIVRGLGHEVWVVAPDEERSGASHSLSMTLPVRVRRVEERHWAVKGTPTDAVLLALHEIMKEEPPDALLSGINRGANLAEDITYSGTAAAAMEGALLGIPAIALSQVFVPGQEAPWETSARHAPPLLARLLDTPLDPGTFINVNFPDVGPDEVTGVRVTTQGQRPPGSFVPQRRIDERHVPYYWIRLAYRDGGFGEGTDLAAIRDRAISVTPLQMDMTAHALVPRLRHLLGGA